MIKIFPKKSFVYKSDLSNDEILDRLKDNIGMPYDYWDIMNLNKVYYKLFSGEIIDNSFKLRRSVTKRDIFHPIIKGNIVENGKQSYIYIEIKLSTKKCILYIWLKLMFLICLIIIFFYLFNEGLSPIIAPFILTLLGGILPDIIFLYECKKTNEILQKIFNAEIIHK